MQRLTYLVPLLALLLLPLPLPLPVEARAGQRAAQKRAAARVSPSRGQTVAKPPKPPSPPPPPPSPCVVLDAKLNTAQRPGWGNDVALVRPSDVFECARTRTVFTNATLRQALQDLNTTILYIQNFYSLLPLSRKSPDLDLPSSYDVLAALRELTTRPWVYQEELYGNISAAISRLEDGHTGMAFVSNVPTYYRLVLPLVAVVENGQPTVRIAPASLNSAAYMGAAAGAPFRFNAGVYSSAKVISIEGTPAWSYMQDWVRNSSGGYHNLGQKMNEAFARIDFNSYRRTYAVGTFAGRTANPGVDFVQMVLQRNGSTGSEAVAVPWLAVVDMTYSPFSTTTPKRRLREALLTTISPPDRVPLHLDPQLQARPHPFSAEAGGLQRRAVRRGLAGGDEREAQGSGGAVPRGLAATGGGAGGAPPGILMRRRQRIPEEFRLDPPARFQAPVVAPGLATRVSANTDIWEVYRLADNKTGVVVIATFSLSSSTGAALDRTFVTETLKAFATLNRFNCTQIIIDLTGNPGGFVHHGTWFIQMLLGSDNTASVSRVASFDTWRFLAGSALVEDLARQRNGMWAPSNWQDTSGKNYTNATQDRFFFPTERITYPGSTTPAVYSRAFLFPQGTVQNFLNVTKVDPAFRNKRVVLFSDGLCFSTCNTVASTLKRSFGIPLVTAGGLYTGTAGPVKMAFAAGGGGFVSGDMERDVLKDFGLLATRDGAPKKYNGPLALGMRIAAGFYGGARIPIEFSALKPDFQVNYTTANVADASTLYTDVAKYFSR